MKCADCQHIKRHQNASQAMYRASNGFSGCALRPAYEYFSRLRERECADYLPKVSHE